MKKGGQQLFEENEMPIWEDGLVPTGDGLHWRSAPRKAPPARETGVSLEGGE